jgi:hypothetical protein
VDAAAGDARVSGRAGYTCGFGMVASPVNVPDGFVDPRCHSRIYDAPDFSLNRPGAIVAYDAGEAFASCSGAGSVADGSWTCGNCGCANSVLNDVCPACFVGTAP